MIITNNNYDIVEVAILQPINYECNCGEQKSLTAYYYCCSSRFLDVKSCLPNNK